VLSTTCLMRQETAFGSGIRLPAAHNGLATKAAGAPAGGIRAAPGMLVRSVRQAAQSEDWQPPNASLTDGLAAARLTALAIDGFAGGPAQRNATPVVSVEVEKTIQ